MNALYTILEPLIKQALAGEGVHRIGSLDAQASDPERGTRQGDTVERAFAANTAQGPSGLKVAAGLAPPKPPPLPKPPTLAKSPVKASKATSPMTAVTDVASTTMSSNALTSPSRKIEGSPV